MQGVEGPSRVREPETDISRERDAGRERCWPPASRASAVKWPPEARLQVRGLAVDDATLERVADAIWMARIRSPRPTTAEEHEDEIPDGLYGAVRGIWIATPRSTGVS